MNLIIAGGRDFNNFDLLEREVSSFICQHLDGYEITIISGKAKGADTLGIKYASKYGLKLKIFEADWNKYGKRAGMIRNKEMAQNSDCLVAFWDGKSKGTANMIEEAKNKGLKTRILYY